MSCRRRRSRMPDTTFGVMYSSERPYTSASRAPRSGTLAQIEAGQPLRRHDVAAPVIEHAQLLQESRRELAVSVAGKPDLPRARWVSQREVARGALDG